MCRLSVFCFARQVASQITEIIDNRKISSNSPSPAGSQGEGDQRNSKKVMLRTVNHS